MLTAAGSLRKRSKVGTRSLDSYSAAPNPESQDAAAAPADSADSDAWADTEYNVYQGHLGNMLTMSTLIFGFCATGTFLSVSFTGEETPMSTQHFINLVENSLQSTVASVAVTMLVFVFSARAAYQYLLYGAPAALQPIYKGMLFITLAEVLLYYSLIAFVNSISNFAKMNYVGPNICPSSPFEIQQPEPHWKTSNTSFCSRVGDSIYQEAATLCAAPGARTAPDILCQVYDGYRNLYAATDGTWWFGWDRQKNWVYPSMFETDDASSIGASSIGFDHASMIPDENNANLFEYWQQEAFLDVVTRTSDSMCAMNAATSAVAAQCPAGTPDSDTCVQARILLLQADACSGGKEDDAVKCRKTCQWTDVGTEWKSTKTIISDKMNDYVRWITGGLWIAVVCRSIAGVTTAFKSLKKYVNQDTVGKFGWMWALDCFGIFDTFCVEVQEEE